MTTWRMAGANRVTETWRCGHSRDHATGASVLRDCERAIVLHALLSAGFQNDAVIIDPVAAAQYKPIRARQLPRVANSWRKLVLAISVDSRRVRSARNSRGKRSLKIRADYNALQSAPCRRIRIHETQIHVR